MKHYLRLALVSTLLFNLFGCHSMSRPQLETVDHVDIKRFMGDWYVIANIPTFIDDNAYNAVESYRLEDDGTIATTFSFREGSFDGKKKTYHPTGFVKDKQTNALWGMQFVWPIKADYRIVYLTEDYQQVIIGRNKRDYVWIMARTPQIPEQDYQYMLSLIAGMGYEISEIKPVPQKWPEMEK